MTRMWKKVHLLIGCNGKIQGSLRYGGKSAASGRDDVVFEWQSSFDKEL